MPGIALSLDPAVNLAWNLAVLQSNVDAGHEESARSVARRMDPPPHANKVTASWQHSALRRHVAKFAAGTEAKPLPIAATLDRLTHRVPQMRIRLIERLFGVADALNAEFTKRLLTTLEDEDGFHHLRSWLNERINLFKILEKQVSQGLSPEEDRLFRRYLSSYWQTLCNIRAAASYFAENSFPILSDNKMLQIVKQDPKKTRPIDDQNDFFLSGSRREFVYGLVNELLYEAKNRRWQNNILLIEQPQAREKYRALIWMQSALKDLPSWPPPADDWQFLSFQRVSGLKISFEIVDDETVRASIDFGKMLRVK